MEEVHIPEDVDYDRFEGLSRALGESLKSVIEGTSPKHPQIVPKMRLLPHFTPHNDGVSKFNEEFGKRCKLALSHDSLLTCLPRAEAIQYACCLSFIVKYRQRLIPICGYTFMISWN